jgi:ATP-dependent Clp protease protease subunit
MSKSRVIQIFGDIDAKQIERILHELQILNKQSSKPIEMRITSSGGFIPLGFAIYDAIRLSKAPVETVVYGEACSMAAVILQAGKRRKATVQSRILIHQVFGQSEGSPKELRVGLKEYLRQQKQIFELLAEKTGKDKKKIARDCQREFFMSAEEALKYGLIDEII